MDISVVTVVVILLMGVALGAGVTLMVSRAIERARRAGEVAQVRAELTQRTAAAEARAERLEQENDQLLDRSRSDSDVLRALAPMHEALARMDKQVGALERERTTQFTALTTQLEEARRADAALLHATRDLGQALRSTSARGSWGEMELRRVLELSGLTRHLSFLEQRTHAGSGEAQRAGRPDVAVHLPGERLVLLDAKVPMDAFLRAAALVEVPSDDPRTPEQIHAARTAALAEHAKALRSHVTALASREYQTQVDGSVEIVVLFLPTESLLSQALDADPALLEHALRSGVALATPTSLLALLRSVAAVWAQEKLADEAQEILALGREMTSRLGVVAGHVDKLGGSLRSAVQHYNRSVGSLEDRLLVTARRFESLAGDGSTVPELAPLPSERAQVRSFTSIEPVEEQQRRTG